MVVGRFLWGDIYVGNYKFDYQCVLLNIVAWIMR